MSLYKLQLKTDANGTVVDMDIEALRAIQDGNGNNIVNTYATKTELQNAVIANPTLSGTEADLTSLQVGNTKYKVPSGGSGSYLPLSGGQMTGPLSWADGSALPQKDLSYILGIDGFAQGGETGWMNASALLAKAKYFTCIGIDRDTNIGNKNGYWAGMTTTIGPNNKWWHVLSMDWSGNDQNNWFSQLALPTQDGGVPHYRRNNSSGTAIGSSTWHAFWTEENMPKKYKHNIILKQSSSSSSKRMLSFTLETPDSSAYTTYDQVQVALRDNGFDTEYCPCSGFVAYNVGCCGIKAKYVNSYNFVAVYTYVLTNGGEPSNNGYSKSEFIVFQDKVTD